MKKQLVIVLIRVSTKAQDWERQRRKVQKILRFFNNLEQLEEIALKVTGTVVEKTTEYRHAQTLLRRRDVVGMVIPSIDRWFRYKLVSELGRYCEPFEEMSDGKTAKLIYCTLNEKCVSLDMQLRADQDVLIDGARYASKEREVINARLTDGKDIGREDPECCIDPTPDGVEFRPYNTQETDKEGYKRTLVKGSFAYTDFAFNSVEPLFYRFKDGEPLYRLYKELGFGTIMHCRHTLRNLWWLGFKHRTKTVTKKEWDYELNRLRHQNIKDIGDIEKTDKTRFVVATNLAETPLIPQDVFDAVQAKLAVRKDEYYRREKHADEFLADPLFRCKKCGAKMYPRIGHQNRPDTYTCATRFSKGKTGCDEPLYKRELLDNAVASRLYMLLNNARYLKAKMEESVSEEHRTAAKANVATKERLIAEIEKKCSRTRKAIVETDDAGLSALLKQLNLELANAKADLRAAQSEADEIPRVDYDAATQQAKTDAAGFYSMDVAGKKAMLAKYTSLSTATIKPATDEYVVEFKFKITAPVMEDEPTSAPRSPSPSAISPDTDYGQPIRIKLLAGTKTESLCSAW